LSNDELRAISGMTDSEFGAYLQARSDALQVVEEEPLARAEAKALSSITPSKADVGVA
jgi:hypothetical protein